MQNNNVTDFDKSSSVTFTKPLDFKDSNYFKRYMDILMDKSKDDDVMGYEENETNDDDDEYFVD